MISATFSNAFFRAIGLSICLLASIAAKKAARSDGGPRQYLSRDDAWFKTDEAKTIAENILSYQSETGGWPKNIDTTAKPYDGDRARLKSSFDNNATMDELRLLAHFYQATKDDRYRAAVEKGIDCLLKAQYPTGGWPQSYPPDRSYHRYITFNDGAMVRVLELLRDTYTAPVFSFVGEKQKQATQTAFANGIQCILKCQIKVDGKLTAWCAQHDELNYSPRPARTFELASISGSESVGIVELLMSIEPPTPEIARSVEAAVAWFESAKLKGIRVDQQDAPDTAKGHDRVVIQDENAPPLWARFYDIKTNKPIYADRDGVPKEDLEEIGYERRNGYRWIYDWPKPLLETEYPAWQEKWKDLISKADGQ